jgi:hypothetical protein
LKAAFQGADRFLPMNYRQDFEAVREVALKSGEVMDRAGIERKKQEAGK